MQWTSGKCLPEEPITIRETLFDKLESFAIKYTSEQSFFKKLLFESIFIQGEILRDTNTTAWIGKHVLISVSISSNPMEEPIFFCKFDPHHLVASFIGTLENSGSESKTKMKILFFDIETTKKIKLGNIWEKRSQRHNQREQAIIARWLC